MRILFVHGMGRSPLSGWPMLRQLKQAGLSTASFAYTTSLDSFNGITARLGKRIRQLAEQGEYCLIGHSLGGVLIRAALADLPPGTRQPSRVFLLGSPQRASRLAQSLQGNALYRMLTRDCGQLLASELRMLSVPPLSAPSTGIFGVRGLALQQGPFGGEANDGVVAISEIAADWIDDTVRIPVIHTLLPASRLVAAIILERLAGLPQTSSA